jgi:hypothetical protein
MASVLHQEESLATWHHAYAEAEKVVVEGDLILGRNLTIGFFGMRRDAGATRITSSDEVVNEQLASRQ